MEETRVVWETKTLVMNFNLYEGTIMETIYHLDFAILDWIQSNLRCTFFDIVMPAITATGNNGFIFIVLTLLLLCFKKTRPIGILSTVTLFVGAVIGNIILKPMFGRIRPYDINTGVVLLIDKLPDFSFPSGHTLAAFGFAASVFLCNKRYGLFAFLFAAFMGFSRLYLYVHFPTDVIVSMILGCTIAYLSMVFIRMISKNKKFPLGGDAD